MKIEKANIKAIMWGIIISFFLKEMISRFLVSFEIIDPCCYKLPLEDYLKEFENIKLIFEIFVFPIVSIVTGLAVGLTCITKPWLWGMIAIALECIFTLPPLHLTLFPMQSVLSPYLNLSSSIKELLLDFCLYLFISSSVSYFTFQLKNQYLAKKAGGNLLSDGGK